jgi:rubredoxin
VTEPIPMVLHCPECKERHIDEGDFAMKPHHTHSCQSCGLTWRPAIAATVGVQFLPGFKNDGRAAPHLQVGLDAVNRILRLSGKITRQGEQVKCWTPDSDGGTEATYLDAATCSELARAFDIMAAALGRAAAKEGT